MRKYHLLTAIALLFTMPSLAQFELWGTSSNGGSYGVGTIFKINNDLSNLQVNHSFLSNNPGSQPYGSLVLASNNKMYGLTTQGGVCSDGTIFEFDPNTGIYNTIFHFEYLNTGGWANGNLIEAFNGKLYGIAFGGPAQKGIIFEFDPVTLVYNILTDFNGYNFGVNLDGSLIQATNGKLYGLGSGGNNNDGVIYSYDLSTNTLTKLFDFGGIIGNEPRGSLLQASNGKLYGLTLDGGTNSYGVIFEFDISTSTYTKKADLSITTGGISSGSFMEASNGFLYAMTNEGGSGNYGTILEFDPATGALNVISFNGTNGNHPYIGTLIEAQNGNLYGMTSQGGSNSLGNIFEFDPASQTIINKQSFNLNNGYYPTGNLIIGNTNKFYGLTPGGGIGDGNLFEYDYITNTLTNILNLNASPTGNYPAGGLTLSSNGKLYGFTQKGGSNAMGVVYEYDPTINSYTSLADFNSTNGGYISQGGFPAITKSELVEANNGKLYGLMKSGVGINNVYGSLFEFNIQTNTITKKFEFTNTALGIRPGFGLFNASDGKLYGTTVNGGANNHGVLFSYDPTTDNYQKLADYNSTVTGSNTQGILTENTPGIIYGVSSSGGSNGNGTIFTYIITTGNLLKKADFNFNLTGGSPLVPPLLASNGKLYGFTSNGAANGIGAFYEFDTITSVINVIHNFYNSSNNTALGTLIQIPGGKIIGLKNQGEYETKGLLFVYDLNTNTFNELPIFNCQSTINPTSSTLKLINTEASSLVWPGDVNFDLIVDNIDFLYLGIAFNETGLVRTGASLNWIGQPSLAWSQKFYSGVNFKHADTNGDGVIDISDDNAIYQNYSQQHNFKLSNQSSLSTSVDLTIIADTSVVAPGNVISFDIFLGDSLTSLDSLYGIAFTLYFDQNLIDTSQFSFNFNPSIFGNINTDFVSLVKNQFSFGKSDVALTRINQMNLTNISGKIGTLTLKTSSNISSLSDLVITPSNVTGITLGENIIHLGSVSDTVSLDPFLNINSINFSHINIYPNPVKTELKINSSHDKIFEVEFRDINGRLLKQFFPNSENSVLTLSNFKNGFYFLSITTEKGKFHKKIIISKE